MKNVRLILCLLLVGKSAYMNVPPIGSPVLPGLEQYMERLIASFNLSGEVTTVEVTSG